MQIEDNNNDADFEDEPPSLDSGSRSVSLALKECQERRFRSEALFKKLDSQRPITLDLNNATAATAKLSLQLASMKIASVISSHTSGGGGGSVTIDN